MLFYLVINIIYILDTKNNFAVGWAQQFKEHECVCMSVSVGWGVLEGLRVLKIVEGGKGGCKNIKYFFMYIFYAFKF